MNYRKIIQSIRDLNEGILLAVGIAILCLLFTSSCQFIETHPEIVQEAEELGLESVEKFIENSSHMHNSLQANHTCASLSLSF